MHDTSHPQAGTTAEYTGPRLRTSVARTAEALQNDYLHSPQHNKQARARAVLAQLRKYSAVRLEQHPVALEEVLLLLEPALSEQEMGKGAAPSASELAAFQAMTMLGIHLQSASTEAHIKGQSFARACGRFYAHSQSQSTKPRFDAMLVSSDEASRLIHIRSLVTLLRGENLGFDYGAFAQELRVLGSKNATQKAHTQRQGVLLKWARDFALGSYASSQTEPTS